MNYAAMRLRKEALDLLDECKSTSHQIITPEAENHLQKFVDGVGEFRGQGDLSPGQKQAMEAGGKLLDDVQIERETSTLSPGQRAAKEAV